MLLLVRHLLLVAWHLFRIASCYEKHTFWDCDVHGVLEQVATRSKAHPMASPIGARTLLGAPGIATRSILTTSNKKLLGAPSSVGLISGLLAEVLHGCGKRRGKRVRHQTSPQIHNITGHRITQQHISRHCTTYLRFTEQSSKSPRLETMFATRNKCIATSNRCLTSSNKKLLGTGALLVVTRSY